MVELVKPLTGPGVSLHQDLDRHIASSQCTLQRSILSVLFHKYFRRMFSELVHCSRKRCTRPALIYPHHSVLGQKLNLLH